ncbi:NnrS family protein, partial [Alcanivorax sp. HI0044]|uniref:NnrS family protein n=3 Tax=Alcanivorax TaxID=59753 RepID=UPI000B0647E9
MATPDSTSDTPGAQARQPPRGLQAPLFAFPFRLFFLSAALIAAVLVPLWVFLLTRGGLNNLALPPMLWH